MDADNAAIQESLALFRNSQGNELRGNLLRFTRYLIVFEFSSTSAVLQTSEVLSELKILLHDRPVYSGNAVVRTLVNTGLMTLCEATLDPESWLDVDFSLARSTNGELGQQFNEFLGTWQKLYRVDPEYKVAVADLQTFLTDVRLWLEQVELGIRSSPTGDRTRLERDAALHLEPVVVPPIAALFDRFETVAQRVSDEDQAAHRAFARRLVHPLLLCSPFVHRTFRKPLGYAGDYEVVNMMFRDACEGGSLFAKIINLYALQLPPIRAHRNRIGFLADLLVREALRAQRQNRVARIFNLGCGPAHEIQRFLAISSACDHTAFTLADFNEETILHVGGKLQELKRLHGRKTPIQVLKRSVQQLLKQSDRSIPASDQYDVVYCAGLFDYLPDKICRRLVELFYNMLAPGGLLVVTNVDVHPSRGEMECFLEWHLIHRNTPQMASLAPSHVQPHDLSLKRDDTGVNIFLELRKPENA